MNYCSFTDFDGCLLSFSTFKSNAGNAGYRLKFQASQAASATIKILKTSNNSITDSYLKCLKQTGEPLSIKNLNRGSDGVLFCKTSRGSKTQSSSDVNFAYNNNNVSTVKSVKKE